MCGRFGEMKAHLYLTCFFLSFSSLQLQLIGNAGGNVFKGGRCARYTLEADPIQTQARQFTHLKGRWLESIGPKTITHLHFPLDQVILASVTVHAEKHELLALLVIAMIISKNLERAAWVRFSNFTLLLTLIISFTIAVGSIELVVFIDHVNLFKNCLLRVARKASLAVVESVETVQ